MLPMTEQTISIMKMRMSHVPAAQEMQLLLIQKKQTDCDGQTGYTTHILDGIIDKLVRQIFERMKAIPKSEIVNVRYREKMEERRSLLHSIRTDYTKAATELNTLKGEVVKSIKGESAFSTELLSSMITDRKSVV